MKRMISLGPFSNRWDYWSGQSGLGSRIGFCPQGIRAIFGKLDTSRYHEFRFYPIKPRGRSIKIELKASELAQTIYWRVAGRKNWNRFYSPAATKRLLIEFPELKEESTKSSFKRSSRAIYAKAIPKSRIK